MTGGYQPAKAQRGRDDRSEECYLLDFCDTLFSTQHGLVRLLSIPYVTLSFVLCNTVAENIGTR